MMVQRLDHLVQIKYTPFMVEKTDTGDINLMSSNKTGVRLYNRDDDFNETSYYNEEHFVCSESVELF